MHSYRYISMQAAFAALIFILLVSGCSSKNKVIMSPEQFAQTSSEGEIRLSDDLFTEYHIAPGDVLDVLFQIQSWKENPNFILAVDQEVTVKYENNPELNETQTIRPDGTISLPFLGNIHVTGKSVAELTKELKKQYTEKQILQVPELYVIVGEFRTAIKELKADLHTAPRGLSRLVTVRPDGYATFPMLGDVMVAGKSIPAVGNVLNEQYKTIVDGLHCDLFLETHSGSLIYIVGQVRNPGEYAITRPISVLKALTLAGGFSEGAKLGSVIVARKQNNRIIATRVDVKDALSFNDIKDLFYLQPEDIVFVPQTWIYKASEVAQQIGNMMLFKGWGGNLSWELHDEAPDTE
jgi:polysaccharide biosynthesis/export protein